MVYESEVCKDVSSPTRGSRSVAAGQFSLVSGKVCRSMSDASARSYTYSRSQSLPAQETAKHNAQRTSVAVPDRALILRALQTKYASDRHFAPGSERVAGTGVVEIVVCNVRLAALSCRFRQSPCYTSCSGLRLTNAIGTQTTWAGLSEPSEPSIGVGHRAA